MRRGLPRHASRRAPRAGFPGAGQASTIMTPSIHANHELHFLKMAKKGLQLGQNGGLLKMPDKSDSDGDGKMWRQADFARWADPASRCGAFAQGWAVEVGRFGVQMRSSGLACAAFSIGGIRPVGCRYGWWQGRGQFAPGVKMHFGEP